MTDKYIIGLTGIMGSGKSFVAKIAQEFGVDVIDVDKIAFEVLDSDTEIRYEIDRRWGDKVSIYDDDTVIYRNKIAQIIFDNDEEHKWYNDLLIPVIYDIVKVKIENSKKQIILVDAPLLFETGFDKEVNESWVVKTDLDLAINRIKKRNPGITEKIIKKIMSKQWTQEEKIKKAVYVLDNNKNGMAVKRQLWNNVENLIINIKIKLL